MDVDDEAIGLVRAHRWADAKAQTKRLKEAGCSRIFDLDAQDRKDMERIGGRRRVLLVYAFLLADLDVEPRKDEDQAKAIWRDLSAVLTRIEKRGGQVVDVGTGLDSQLNPAEFGDVVRGQIRRHRQGENPATRKGKPGRQKLTFTRGQIMQAREIWKDLENYPDNASAVAALEKIKSAEDVSFSESRAYRRFKKRKTREGPRKRVLEPKQRK
jgi:hypothetical protein